MVVVGAEQPQVRPAGRIGQICEVGADGCEPRLLHRHALGADGQRRPAALGRRQHPTALVPRHRRHRPLVPRHERAVGAEARVEREVRGARQLHGPWRVRRETDDRDVTLVDHVRDSRAVGRHRWRLGGATRRLLGETTCRPAGRGLEPQVAVDRCVHQRRPIGHPREATSAERATASRCGGRGDDDLWPTIEGHRHELCPATAGGDERHEPASWLQPGFGQLTARGHHRSADHRRTVPVGLAR